MLMLSRQVPQLYCSWWFGYLVPGGAPHHHGCRRQLEEISDLLDAADPVLSQKLNRLDCAEIYFAYRMVLVMMRRELPLSEVPPSVIGPEVQYSCG